MTSKSFNKQSGMKYKQQKSFPVGESSSLDIIWRGDDRSSELIWRGDDRPSELVWRSDDRSSETVWRGDDRSSDRHFLPMIAHLK